MADQDILARIHGSSKRSTGWRDGSETDPDRLRRLEEQLDQCWDLLRQRRAKREFGQSESEAEVRSTETVERYQG